MGNETIEIGKKNSRLKIRFQ